MTVRYLALDDYLAIAVEVTGQPVETFINAAKKDLADSALHVPAASFAGEEFYPNFVDKAAVLIVRLARTIRFLMATSAPHGCRFDSSLSSTTGRSTLTHRSMRPRPAYRRSPLAPGTSKRPPTGSD